MKEEFKILKELTVKFKETKEEYLKQRVFFNLKVEEQKKNLGINDDSNLKIDSYEEAKLLNEEFPELHEVVTQLKEEFPKYGDKRLKELALKRVAYITSEESKIRSDIDNYFIYKNCGFYQLYDLESQLVDLENEIKEIGVQLFGESKQVIIENGTKIIDIVKPYGEVAKEKFNTVGVATKKMVNNGSKKLIKIFEDIERKTSDNQE